MTGGDFLTTRVEAAADALTSLGMKKGCWAAGTGRRARPSWSSGIPSSFSSTLEYSLSLIFCCGELSPTTIGNGFRPPDVWKPRVLLAADLPVSYSSVKHSERKEIHFLCQRKDHRVGLNGSPTYRGLGEFQSRRCSRTFLPGVYK